MGFYCSQIYTGTIIINEINKQAVAMNCAEFYSHMKSIHTLWSFGSQKGAVLYTSLLPIQLRCHGICNDH